DLQAVQGPPPPGLPSPDGQGLTLGARSDGRRRGAEQRGVPGVVRSWGAVRLVVGPGAPRAGRTRGGRATGPSPGNARRRPRLLPGGARASLTLNDDACPGAPVRPVPRVRGDLR